MTSQNAPNRGLGCDQAVRPRGMRSRSCPVRVAAGLVENAAESVVEKLGHDGRAAVGVGQDPAMAGGRYFIKRALCEIGHIERALPGHDQIVAGMYHEGRDVVGG